jgi:hypothetical protein
MKCLRADCLVDHCPVGGKDFPLYDYDRYSLSSV